MRKVLVLLMILGLAAVTNAAMVLDISVNGDPDPVDSMIELLPSETLELDIHETGIGYVVGDDLYWAMTVGSGPGTISGGVPTAGAPTDSAWYGDDANPNYYNPVNEEGSWGFIGDIAGAAKAPGEYINGILFHCEDLGDVVVNLWSTTDFITYIVEDSLVIHQIPEPMTMALLGLGGLFLRRRK